MSVSYLAIGYACNQRCRFCPCSREEVTYPQVDADGLRASIDEIIKDEEIDAFVVSGGEPTLHPQFINTIKYLIDKRKFVTILSNSERFSNDGFVEKFFTVCNPEYIQIITTIHSQDKDEHEWINQTSGSFGRTIQGLKNCYKYGAHITIKHCITKRNYKDLKKFYMFINREFDENCDIQLCSIDYCGLGRELLEQKLEFPKLAPYLEEMFDRYMYDVSLGSKRHLYCINMPLCSADPYYWQFFKGKADGYTAYAAPKNTGEMKTADNVENITGTFFDACKRCLAEEICAGTYRTAYEYFGDSIVCPYEQEEGSDE